MNAKTRYKVQLGLESARLMTVRRDKIIANLTVCVGIFVLGLEGGAITPAIGAMAFVQSVNLPEMVEAYQEAKRRGPPIQYEENDPPPRRER